MKTPRDLLCSRHPDWESATRERLECALELIRRDADRPACAPPASTPWWSVLVDLFLVSPRHLWKWLGVAWGLVIGFNLAVSGILGESQESRPDARRAAAVREAFREQQAMLRSLLAEDAGLKEAPLPAMPSPRSHHIPRNHHAG